MAISSPGIGSNLDVNGIISQLMAIERQPLTKIDIKEASYQTKLSAMGSLKGVLASLQSSLGALTKAATFAGSYKASSSDTSVFTASASDKATTGSNSVSVEQLAQAQKLRTSNTFSGVNAAVGSGTITIQFGTTTPAVGDPDPDKLTLPAGFVANADKAATTITIDPAKNTLLDIRDAINKGNAGVTASIVNDGSGYRLAIVANDPGAANSLKITVDDDDAGDTDASGISTLAFDPTSAAPRNLAVSQAAKNALLTVDGIPVVKSSNTITDTIEGVTLNLQKVGGPANVSVSFDRGSISTSVQAFVKAYNEANKSLREMGAYNAETKVAGPLQGDPVVRTVQNQLRAAMRGNLTYAAGGFSNLAEIGISFARDGSMTLDQAKLNSAINNPAKDVGALFMAMAKASDSAISVVSSPKGQYTGRYAVTVSQLATQGLAEATLSSRTIVAGVNDSFALSVDGVSATVTLGAGTYTGDALAAEIQSKVNGASALKTAGASLKAVFSRSDSTLTGSAPADLIGLTPGSFDITIGGTTKTIAVDDGATYADAAALAADLQTKINTAFTAEGHTVTVGQSGGTLSIATSGLLAPPSVANGVAATLFGTTPTGVAGFEKMTLTSAKYGSESKVTSVVAGFVSGSSATTGIDVAGTIGGATAIGSGQDLTADGVAEGLKIKITGGALGDRGYVTHETGFAQRLNDVLTGLTSSKGVIDSKSKGVQSSIDQLDDRRDILARRLAQIEARYRKQFTALDSMMSQMTQTSNYLSQQLARLPTASSGQA